MRHAAIRISNSSDVSRLKSEGLMESSTTQSNDRNRVIWLDGFVCR
jgi:hypothetical protein